MGAKNKKRPKKSPARRATSGVKERKKLPSARTLARWLKLADVDRQLEKARAEKAERDLADAKRSLEHWRPKIAALDAFAAVLQAHWRG